VTTGQVVAEWNGRQYLATVDGYGIAIVTGLQLVDAEEEASNERENQTPAH